MSCYALHATAHTIILLFMLLEKQRQRKFCVQAVLGQCLSSHVVSKLSYILNCHALTVLVLVIVNFFLCHSFIIQYVLPVRQVKISAHRWIVAILYMTMLCYNFVPGVNTGVIITQHHLLSK